MKSIACWISRRCAALRQSWTSGTCPLDEPDHALVQPEGVCGREHAPGGDRAGRVLTGVVKSCAIGGIARQATNIYAWVSAAGRCWSSHWTQSQHVTQSSHSHPSQHVTQSHIGSQWTSSNTAQRHRPKDHNGHHHIANIEHVDYPHHCFCSQIVRFSFRAVQRV